MARFRPRLRRTNSKSTMTSSISKAAARRSRFRRLFPRLLPFDGFRKSSAVERLVSWFTTPGLTTRSHVTNYVGCGVGLNVEGLEDRRLLAAFTWTGATDTDWGDQANWDIGDGTPGDDGIPTSADSADIPDLANDPVLDANRAVGDLNGSAPLDLQGFTLEIGALNGTSNYSGDISGAGGGLSKVGTGTLLLSGNNSYTGITNVSEGLLSVISLTALGSDAGETIVSGGGGVNGFVPGSYSEPFTISDFFAGNVDFAIGADADITLSGTITLAAPSALAVAGRTMTVTGQITGAGPLTLDGAIAGDTIVLSNTSNDYTGGTQVGSPTSPPADVILQLGASEVIPDGSSVDILADSQLDLNGNSETIGGLSGDGEVINTGAAAALTVNGVVSPGASPGILTVSDLMFGVGGNFDVEINGTTPGTQHDQLVVIGSVDLNNASLTLSGTGLPTFGDSATIIDNQGAGAVAGTFAGLVEGQAVFLAGAFYEISYTGGDGNDVVLTRLAAGIYEFDMPTSGAGEAGVGGGQTVPQLMVLGDFSNITNPADRTVQLQPTFLGSATLNADYTLTGFIIPQVNFTTPTTFDLTVTNAPNTAPSFTVISDLLVEGDETVQIGASNTGTLISPGDIDGMSGTELLDIHTILDDDTATLDIVAAQDVTEEGGPQTLDVTLSITGTGSGTAALGHATTITADVTDAMTGSASATDYTAFGTQTVTFGPNTVTAATRQVTIAPISDMIVEGSETVDLDLGNLTVVMGNAVAPATVDAQLGNTDSLVTILDDNGAGGVDQLDVEFAAASTSADESATMPASDFPQLIISGESEIDQNVDLVVTNTDAEVGDFTTVIPVTIPAGVYVATVFDLSPTNFTVNDDLIVERDEFIDLQLQNASAGVAIGAQDTTTHTILDDDDAVLSIGDVSMVEGDMGTTIFTFTVMVDLAVEGGFSVDADTVDGSATAADNDFVANSQTLNFVGNAGETQTFSVTVNGDLKVEGDELFEVPLSNVTPTDGGIASSKIDDSVTADGTIENDDSATLTIGDISMTEGDAGTKTYNFNVTLDNPVQGGFDINIETIDGTATDADGDYDAVGTTLAFAGTAGETQTFSVTVNGDTKVEPDEMFTVDLIDGSLAVNDALVDPADIDVTATATGTIENDDAAFITLSNVTRTENAGGGITGTLFSFTATLHGNAAAPFAIDYNAMPVGLAPATIATDIVAGTESGTAMFTTGLDGDTATINIEVVNDNVVEADEGFKVVLSNLTPALNVTLPASNDASQGQAVILNDDEATFTIGDVSMLEGTGGTTNFNFTVMVDNPVQGGYELGFTVDHVTTSPGDWTVSTSSPLVYGDADTANKTITVAVDADAIAEGDEIFEVLLNSISPLGIGVDASDFNLPAAAEGEILNDDGPMISVADITMQEGTNGSTNFIFNVVLAATVQDSNGFSVNFVVNDNTATDADDFDVLTTSPLHFAGNGTVTPPQTQQVIVSVGADNKVERDETFNLELTGITGDDTGNATFQTTPAIAVILNDDVANVTITDVAQAEGSGGGTTNFNFTVTLDAPVDGGFTLPFSVNPVSPNTGDWTQVTSSPLTFAGGAESQTITVAVNADNMVEGDETFEIDLGPVSGTALGINPADIVVGGPATGTIENDDSVRVEVQSVSFDESAGTVTVDVQHVAGTAMSGAFSVDAIANLTGGATAEANDFTASSQTLNFSGTPGDTQTYSFSILEDSFIEINETVTIDLSGQSPPNFQLVDGTVTILDNDKLAVEFDAATSAALEGDNGVLNNLPRLVVTGQVQDPVTVSVSAVGINPNPASGGDFSQPGTVTITSGSYNVTPVSTGFASIEDTTVENDETVELTLTNILSNPRVNHVDVDSDSVVRSTTVHTILNDDGATSMATVNGLSSVSINEGGTVLLEGMIFNTPQQHVISIQWGDGASSSITVNPAQFSGGKANYSINHTYLDDVPTGDPSETYNVIITITPASGPAFQVNPAPQVTVNNVAPTFTSLNVSPTSGTVPAQVTVNGTFQDPGILDTFTFLIDVNGADPFEITAPVSNGTIPPMTFTVPAATNVLRFRITDDDLGQTTQTVSVNFQGQQPPQTAVFDSRVFYNQSAFDGNNPAANASDVAAIDTGKTSLGIGQQATFSNVTGYDKGLNGVTFVVNNLPNDGAGLSASDFLVRRGTTNNINSWVTGPAPSSIVVLPNSVGGADRILLTFANGSIIDTYAAFQILPTANTGLSSSHTAIFGNVRGDTGSAFTGQGSFFGRGASDLQSMAQPGVLFSPAGVGSVTDVNKSGITDAFDFQALAVAGINLNVIPVITPGFSAVPAPGFASAVDEAVADDEDDAMVSDGNGSVGGSVDGRVDANEDDDLDLAFATFGSDADDSVDLIGTLASDRLSL